MTGAPLPAGADAVCMLEEVSTERDGATVVIERTVAAGDFVRHAGQDVGVGDTVLHEGSVLTPARIGVLASQGMTDIAVYPMPRIGVLSTGDELVSGSGPLPRERSGTPTGTPSWHWSGAKGGGSRPGRLR